MRLILIIHKYMNRLNKGHHPKVKLLKNTKIKQKSENDVKKNSFRKLFEKKTSKTRKP